MRAAKVRLDLVLETDQAQAQAYFSFIDPQHPYGIPYSVVGISVDWESDLASGHSELDLSENCSSVGRSLFPGQAWPLLLRLEGWRNESQTLRSLRLRIWGFRG